MLKGFEHCASLKVGEKTVFVGSEETTYNNLKCVTNPKYYENAVEWTMHIKNTGCENSPQISDFCGLDLDITCENKECVQVNTLRGDNCSSDSFMPISKRLYVTDRFRARSLTGRSSDTEAFPFFDITIGEKTYVFGIGWSGCWGLNIDRYTDRVHITVFQPDCDFFLYPSEEVRAARILMYYNEAPADECRYRFRETIRNHIAPKNIKMPISSHVFDRYYWNNTEGFRSEEVQLNIAENSAKISNIDTFWLDAAWFRNAFPTGVGNYDFEPGFPNGLSALSEKVHSLGMRFMVWFEPERIHCGSDTYKKYGSDPKFILDTHNNPESKMLNLGYQPAFDYLYETISGFIKKYNIDIFRVDHNFDTAPYWSENDDPGRKGITQIRSVEGLYAFWDKVLSEFPGIMIDNCSSGGRRIDLETMARSVSCWRSDTGCFPETAEEKKPIWSQCISVLLSQYIPFHQTVAWEPNYYLIRSGMGEGVACAFDLMNNKFAVEDANKKLNEVIELAKYRKGKTICLTENTHDDTIWFAYELQLDDSGCAFAFRRESCDEETFLIKPIINEPNKEYKVIIRDENGNITIKNTSGAEIQNGIILNSTAPRQSFSIEWK